MIKFLLIVFAPLALFANEETHRVKIITIKDFNRPSESRIARETCLAAMASSLTARRIIKQGKISTGKAASLGKKIAEAKGKDIVLDSMIRAVISIYPPLAFILLIKKGKSIYDAYRLVTKTAKNISAKKTAENMESISIHRFTNVDGTKTWDIMYLNTRNFESAVSTVDNFQEKIRNKELLTEEQINSVEKNLPDNLRDFTHNQVLDLEDCTSDGCRTLSIMVTENDEESTIKDTLKEYSHAKQLSLKEYAQELANEILLENTEKDQGIINLIYKALEKGIKIPGNLKKQIENLKDKSD